MSGYRIYQWGQRVDIYGKGGQFYSLSLSEIQWGVTTRWYMLLMQDLAFQGDDFAKNWLVCKDELIDLGYITEE